VNLFLKRKFDHFKKSSTAQTLFANLSFLTLLQVANYLIPIFTIPYLARVLGVDRFGEIAFATTVMIYFQTIVNYGFSYTATRDIAKNREDKEKISVIFSEVMWASILLMLGSFVLLVVLILLIPKFYQMKELLFISFGLIPGYVLFPQWMFQGLERMKYITFLNILARLVFMFAVFIFIKKESDYLLQPLFTSLGFIISGWIAIYILLAKYHIKWLRPSWLGIKKTLKGSTDVFINQLFPNLYDNFTTVLLGFWGGDYANGILDAGKKFALVSVQFLRTLSIAFFPYLSRNISRHGQYSAMVLLVSGVASCILFFGSPWLIRIFFSEQFEEAIIILKIFAFYPFVMSLSDVYGKTYLIIVRREKVLRNITFMCSVIGFFVAWPMVYYGGYIGAAVTVVMIVLFNGVWVAYKALKLKKRAVVV